MNEPDDVVDNEQTDEFADYGYKRRAAAELEELNERLNDLNEFLRTEKFESLTDEQKGALESQRHHMSSYATVLRERIAAF